MPQLKLITFDLDDTLWDITPIMIAAEQRVRDYLISQMPSTSEWYDRKNMGIIRDQLLADSPELIHNLGRLRLRSLEVALKQQGLDAATVNLLAHSAFEVFCEARNQVRFFDDTLETLQRLKQHFTLGVLTNGNADVARIGIGDYFHFAFTAGKVGISKPHPDMFLRGLEAAGVHADEALHVGDHPEHDVFGAASVGMHTLYFRHFDKDALISESWQPTLVAANMREMEAKIMGFAHQLTATI